MSQAQLSTFPHCNPPLQTLTFSHTQFLNKIVAIKSLFKLCIKCKSTHGLYAESVCFGTQLLGISGELVLKLEHYFN